MAKAKPDALTDARIKKLPNPDKTSITWDTEVKGFGIRVTPAGAKSFVVYYRTQTGRQRLQTIGSYPDWLVAAAREEAKAIKRKVDQGEDPQGDRKALREAPTMADLAEHYRKTHMPRKRSAHADELMLVKDVVPQLGQIKVADVTHSEIAALHRRIAARAPSVANRVVALASKMFSIAIKEGWRSDNPCRGVERMPEERRERYLTPDELRRLFEALEKHPGQSANAVKLLLLTGARKSEVLGATWDMFDLDVGVWTKPSSHTKQKRTHRVPLSADALDVLKNMRRAEDERVAKHKAAGRIVPAEMFLFPSKKPGQSQAWMGKFWQAVCKDAQLGANEPKKGADGKPAIDEKGKPVTVFVPNIRIHDCRHSFASLLASSGLSLPIIGQLLGHTQAATTQRYAHLLDEPLRQATETASKAIADARAAQPKVVQIKR